MTSAELRVLTFVTLTLRTTKPGQYHT